jgi:hypothetical protein
MTFISYKMKVCHRVRQAEAGSARIVMTAAAAFKTLCGLTEPFYIQ